LLQGFFFVFDNTSCYLKNWALIVKITSKKFVLVDKKLLIVCRLIECKKIKSIREGLTIADIKATFAKNVRKYRIELNMSQEKLAETSGLHRTYISAVERMARNISLGNIQKIADALSIKVYRLFQDGGED